MAARGCRRGAAKPLVTMNAGGLAEGVAESELFGHVKGAFTDARADRIGCFELADEGTLFLDEIANMPMRLQAKLLRVLQTGELQRVGSSRLRFVNVRVLSATNADLREEVAGGPVPRRPALPAQHRRASTCRRCASGATIRAAGAALPRALCARATGKPLRGLRRRRDGRRCARTAGPATCASWRTRSSARCCSPIRSDAIAARRSRARSATRRRRRPAEELSLEDAERLSSRKRWRVMPATSAPPPSSSASAAARCTGGSSTYGVRDSAVAARMRGTSSRRSSGLAAARRPAVDRTAV